MRKRHLTVMVGCVLLGCGLPEGEPEQSPPAVASTADELSSVPVAGQLRVMTRNLYVGADVQRIFSATSLAQLPAVVGETYGIVVASRYRERARALAAEIAAQRPQVVGLQEVELIRRQCPGDFFRGNPQAATDVIDDYLQILLQELGSLGRHYAAAAVGTNADVEAPNADGCDLRLTDRDVLLVESGIPWARPDAQPFLVNLTLPLGGLRGPPVVIKRGFVEVDAQVSGRWLHFVDTHLEISDPAPLTAIQYAQASQLVKQLRFEPLPVILIGDFNSDANSNEPSYALIRSAGFVDTWRLARTGDFAPTCCQAEDLRNSVSTLATRIDLVFARDWYDLFSGWLAGGVTAVRVGEQLEDRTPSGLWPSDHAGVAVSLPLFAKPWRIASWGGEPK